VVVGGEVVGGSVGGVDSGGGLVGGGWVATGAASGGGVTVVSGVVVGSELDGGSTDVGRVVAGAESAGAAPVGVERIADVAAGVEAGAAVAMELGTTTSSSTVAGAEAVGSSCSEAPVVGTVDVDVSDVVVAFVNVRAVVMAGAASDAGAGAGPAPGLPELGPCHSAARTNRTTSSTAMTVRPTVLPDGRWSAPPGCGRSLTSMHQFYLTRRTLLRAVGDRAGEAVTRFNIAMIHRAAGRFEDAVRELEITVAFDGQVQHPDLESDTAMLETVRAELTASRAHDPQSALGIH
jgi:hypothetical protein